MKRCLLLVGSFFVIFSCAAETACNWSEIYLGINPSEIKSAMERDLCGERSLPLFRWKTCKTTRDVIRNLK